MLLSTLFLFIEQPKTIIFIILILVLFFGAKRIPEMMRGIGQGVREFKDASTDANKAPQTHQPYNPNQQPQPPYNQQPYANQPTQPYAGQPGYAAQPPVAQPPYPTQPSYGQPQPNPAAPATYDANGQPIS
ncbi:Sec-independent protein translocase subunit TatA/TatB [Hymenobacter polaris]|uniref:Sec-independent protein translocase subunit TatA/TatB n=1 Tax=Hymenobacter polaris TaxID=2682546 RepID=UPI0018A2BAE6|nr:twin-arginine translocase TatA/TatE family subunit [Hymenobacter polaris]